MTNVVSGVFPKGLNFGEVISRFSEALLAKGDVTVDARDWPVLDMAALSVVLATFDAARKQGGRLTLILPERGGVRESLAASGLDDSHLSFDANGGWTGLKVHPGPVVVQPSEISA